MTHLEKIVKEKLPPGKYIIAVSGGVDSVVLLHVTSKMKELELVVAHFDHGIRDDSKLDQGLVAKLSSDLNIPFVTRSVNLGENASEENARNARYEFLFDTLNKHQARGIIVAHHKDDIDETAIFNLLRGTGRKGVTSFNTRPEIYRPLIKVNKKQIKDYAKSNNLIWREDKTNEDVKYSRNLIRFKLAEKKNDPNIKKLEFELDKVRQINKFIDDEVELLFSLVSEEKKLVRSEFIKLPYKVSLEIMSEWLRKNGIRDFDKNFLSKLVVGAKTLSVGSKLSINKAAHLMIEPKFLALNQ
jgi:tRNA(Ile)-lysidine synthetase-like protein